MTSRIVPRGSLGPVVALCALLVPMRVLAMQGDLFVVYLYGVGLVYATATLGLHLLVNDGGDISLAQAGQVAIGAFAGAHLFTHVPGQLGPPALLLGSLLAGALSGFVVSVPMLKLRGLAVAVVTLLLNAAVFNFLLRIPELVGGSGGIRLRAAAWLPADDLAAVEWLTVITIATALAIQFLRAGRFGLGMRAIRSNDDLARSAGVAVERYRMAAYTVAGATAGIAGAMWVVLHQGIAPSAFTEASSLGLLTLALLGGRGSLAGPMTAAICMAVLTGLLGDYGVVVSFLAPAALLLVIIKHPGGINEQLVLVGHGLRAIGRRLASVAPGHGDGDGDGDGDEATVDEATVGARSATSADAAQDVSRPDVRSLDSDGSHPPVLSCSDVEVAFGGLVAVHRVALDVHAGEVLALMGPNGAGKTTLLNALSGHLRPTRGTIWLVGSDITRLPAHRRAARGIRRTFQVAGTMPTESGLDHLRLGHHARRARSRHHIDPLLARITTQLGLSAGNLTAPIADLPAGTSRLVEIGMALAGPGQVLLLDEPTVGLTPEERRRLVATLHHLTDDGLAIILVDHDTSFVRRVAHRIVALDAGEVIARGTPEDVLADPAFVTAYLGSTSAQLDWPDVLV